MWKTAEILILRHQLLPLATSAGRLTFAARALQPILAS
jgi:hypothetical protein